MSSTDQVVIEEDRGCKVQERAQRWKIQHLEEIILRGKIGQIKASREFLDSRLSPNFPTILRFPLIPIGNHSSPSWQGCKCMVLPSPFREEKMDPRHKCSLSTDPSTLLSTETGPGWAPSSMRVLWNWDVGYNRCWEKDNLFPSAVIKTKDHVSPDLLLAIFYTLKKASLRIKPIQKKAEARG